MATQCGTLYSNSIANPSESATCTSPQNTRPLQQSQFPAPRPTVYTQRQMKRTLFPRLALPALAIALFSFALQLNATAQTFHPGSADLTIYSIDVEGGQATLLVAPGSHSLLVDTGWPGNNGRD